VERILSTKKAALWRSVVGPLANNVYVVECLTTGASVVVDAAAEPDVLVEELAPFKPSAILTTHGHGDHIGAVGRLQQEGMTFALHPADQFMVAIEADRSLTEGPFVCGDLDIEVLATPGHTPGSVCFAVDGILITGDTLFPGGPGATRFPYSDFDQIIESIRTKLFVLDPATPFFPGHGESSTIATEAPSLAEWIARRW
jgi:glyoxylase-like metal-dependent hydrolase (beta-lactamase superfamily II)